MICQTQINYPRLHSGIQNSLLFPHLKKKYTASPTCCDSVDMPDGASLTNDVATSRYCGESATPSRFGAYAPIVFTKS